MTPAEEIYDPESQIEAALAAVFTAAALVASTPLTAATFQKARPRTEIKMERGHEKQSYHVFTDGSMRNATWMGQLTLQHIVPTGDSSDGTATMRQYRAGVSSLMAAMKDTLNLLDGNGDRAYLTYHEVQRITLTNSTPNYKFEDGALTCREFYSFEFGVIHGAWSELGLTPA